MYLKCHCAAYFESPATTWITALSYSLPHKGGGSSEGLLYLKINLTGFLATSKRMPEAGNKLNRKRRMIGGKLSHLIRNRMQKVKKT